MQNIVTIGLVAFFPCVQSVPVDGLFGSAFVKEPSGRGTVGLLTSCISTLILCVWTAIHMNIAPPGQGRKSHTGARIWWALIALFAPEVVLVRALFQWHTACNLRDMRNSILDQQRNVTRNRNIAPSDQEQNHKDYWTLEHGFFAGMGGFVVSGKQEDDWILDDGATVAPRGVLELARLGVLPNVDKETITGRSKADLLAKFVVVSQALWMVIQMVGRKIAGFPVTLLELNTLAHIGCALVLYLVWWKKPQDVSEATEIHVEPLLAGYMSSRNLRTVFKPVAPESLRMHTANGVIQSLNLSSPEPRIYNEGPASATVAHEVCDNLLPQNKSQRRVLGTVDTSHWNSSLEIKAIIRKKATHDGLVMLLPGQWLDGMPITPVSSPQHLTASDIERLKLWNGIINHPEFNTMDRKDTSMFCRDARLTQKASHSRIQGNLQEFSESKTLLIFATLGTIYGAVHATSWTGHFPTTLEKFLWQVAVCVVMGGGLCIYLLDCILRYFTRTLLWPLGKGSHLAGRTTRQRTLAFVLVLIIKIIVVAFSAARGFLVVEAFISLRSPPVGTYETVDWAKWIPHIA